MKKLIAVVGTRPDAIKMAPVVLELREHEDMETLLVASGQHREMLDQVLRAFGLEADNDFAVMREGQSLAYLTSSILGGLDAVLESEKPDLVVAQGDTTTTFVAALAAFYRQIPFAHVEAGLRTDTVDSPFPEEFNRRATGEITRMHFAPTDGAARNLLREGHDPESIFVTGNTSIDAVLNVSGRVGKLAAPMPGRMILVTTHRRENWGEPQRAICRAIARLLDACEDTYVVLPMHRNKAVREVLASELGGRERVMLIEPPEYPEFVSLMNAAHLILTDSGGVQEEAPSLGKPVLVLRTETERPEGVEAGSAKLVGTDESRIFEAATKLLSDEAAYAEMAKARNPYGDGRAAKRIVAAIRAHLGLKAEEVVAFEPT